MAIDKLIPQYLNSDTDQKLVKSVEMTDNLNIRVSDDGEGTKGVVKNVKGTDVVSPRNANDTFPAGENRVIGSVSNEKNREILFLLWNINNNHGIYRLDTTSGKYQKLYQDGVLNFQKFSYVDCDVVIKEDEETLFYFTDNVNPPMKVNINRLMTGNYPASLYSGTNEEKLLSLTTAKQPPLSAPSFNFLNNPDIGKNNIYKKNFEFAYQYKYKDGEVSSLSPYSPLSVSETQLKDGFIKNSSKEFYNQINVFVKNSTAPVDEIILYARNSNTQTFYEVEKINNNNTTGVSTILFNDDKISKALSNDDANKSYDNVPQLAKSQAIVGGRLMYGNYKEGYENTDIDIDLNPVYYPDANFFKINISHNGTTDAVVQSAIAPRFDFDFSELPDSLTTSHRVFLEFTIIPNKLLINKAGIAGKYGSIDIEFKNPEEENIEEVGVQMGGKGIVTLSPQGLNVSKVFDFSQTTSKSDFITRVSSYLDSNYFESVVDADNSKLDYASFDSTDKAAPTDVYLWLAGVSFFQFSQISITNSILTSALGFSGADVYVKDAEIKSSSWLINQFTGTKPVDVVSSTNLVLGGLAQFNKFPTANTTGTATYKDFIVAGNASFGGVIYGYKTFKSNSNHSFGIVYLDSRGRASGVNKLDDAFIKPFSGRLRKGKSEFDLRVKNNPPSWARKWMPVYAYNSTYDDFIQYTCGEAYASYNSNDIQGSSLSKKIYLSMTTLEGTGTSYKEQTGALLDYKYENGDTLNIIKYKNKAGSIIYPDSYSFKIVEYKYLSEKESNLFLTKTSSNKKNGGWYLVLDSEDFEGFSSSSIISNSDLWSSETLIEIQKPKKEITEKVYYGIGKTYDVINDTHQGDRTSATLTGGFTVSLIAGNYGLASSTDRYYKGDIVNLGSGIQIEITEVIPVYSLAYLYSFAPYTGSASAQTYPTTTIENYEAVININQGDAYHRVRKLRLSEDYNYNELPEKLKRNRYSYSGGYIESKSVSDFFTSEAQTKGKPYAHIPDAKTIRRRSSITYSDAYVIDSDVLNLSSFNLSLANWIDLDILYGSVQSMINRGDSLTVIQESKASQIPVSRNLLEYANGDTGVSVSTNVLSIPSYYAGDYGTQNPESVIERFGVVYYVDASAGKILRLSANGITPISEKEMDGLFEGILKDVTLNSENKRVIGGFDPDNAEYLVTIEPSSSATVTIGTSVNTVPVDSVGDISLGSIFYSANTVLPNTLNIDWNVYCGNWDEAGNGIIYLDQLSTSQGVLIDDELNGSSATINVIVTDNAYSFIAVATLNLSTGKLTLPATDCEGTSITLSSTDATENGLTISYKHFDGVWGSKYSFKPTSYVDINNDLYSFSNASSGLMWKHNVNETRNNFYGTQYSSVVEVVSNYNPSMVKVFEAMGVEGTGTWSGVLSTSDQSTTLSTSDFDLREGNTYAMIPRDTLVSTSNQIYIGKVISVSGDKITFTTPVNKIPFVVGDTLKTVTGSVITDSGMIISGITERNVIQCTTTVSNIAIGDNILVQHDARVDGDAMRDVFLKINLTSLDTTPFEVHAVSVSYDRSRLHNDRVN